MRMAAVWLSAILLPATPAMAGPDAPRTALLAMFTSKELPDLIKSVLKRRLLSAVRVCFGSYGVDPDQAALAHQNQNGCYAPIMTPFRGDYQERHLSASEGRKLTLSENKYSDPIPSDILALKDDLDELYRWGQELGRRMRDDIRYHVKRGARVDAWQLDELSHTAWRNGPRGEVWRVYMAGVLNGLAFGRTALEDEFMAGFIYVDRPAAFAQLGGEGGHRLLEEMARTSQAIVGEEFINFVGNPKQAARSLDESVNRELRSRGGLWVSLADKYMPQFTPGFKSEPGLHGNIKGKPEQWVSRWLRTFIRERAQASKVGLSEYDFSGKNAGHIDATIEALAYAFGISSSPEPPVAIRVASASSKRRRGDNDPAAAAPTADDAQVTHASIEAATLPTVNTAVLEEPPPLTAEGLRRLRHDVHNNAGTGKSALRTSGGRP